MALKFDTKQVMDQIFGIGGSNDIASALTAVGATGPVGPTGPAGPSPSTPANQVLAGPATGSTAAAAAGRALVTKDLPSNIVISGSVAVNGITSAPAQANFPGTAASADAAVINAITAILVGLGFCKSS